MADLYKFDDSDFDNQIFGDGVNDDSLREQLERDLATNTDSGLERDGVKEAARANSPTVETDYEDWRKNFTYEMDADSIMNPKKKATSSYMNKYAFISYGGNYLTNQGMKNSFIGDGRKVDPVTGIAGPLDKWKEPTAKNIIEWSKTLSPTAGNKSAAGSSVPDFERDNTQSESRSNGTDSGITSDMNIKTSEPFQSSSTAGNASDAAKYGKDSKAHNKSINSKYGSGGVVMGLGNLEYEWKDFAFCKYFGRTPNNYLVTLRRFKLPVLDNGIIAGKERLKEKIASGIHDPEEYLTSDSARALTYMGEGTGNEINSFSGFTVGLNWADHDISTGNPSVNEGIRNANNPLDYPMDGSQLASILTGSNFNVNENSGGFTRALSAWALQQKVEEEGLTDINEYVKKYSKDFDPFSNGYQHRIYGPINVVTRTMYRRRGLRFDGGDISLNFEYNVAQVGSLNPKMAMLDIISNMLALCYNSGQFYGGDYRFQRQPTNFPLPLQLVDMLERMSTGETIDDYGSFFNEMKQYVGGNIEAFVKQSKKEIEDVKANDKLKEQISTLGSDFATLGLTPEAEDIIEGAKEASNTKVSDKSIIEKALHFLPNYAEKFFTGNESILNQVIDIASNIASGDSKFAKIFINSVLFEEQFDIEKIADRMIKINPLITGEPVGEWHLTVGNPMNPFMMIGNLVCTGMTMEFGESLGADDFPTDVKFTVTLKHGRDRDMGDIESMFNHGQGRFYVPTETSEQPWDTGFSSRNTENDTGKLSDIEKGRIEEDGENGYRDADYFDAQLPPQSLDPTPTNIGKPNPMGVGDSTIINNFA